VINTMKKINRIAFSILLIVALTGGAFLLEKVCTEYGETSAQIIKITDKDKVVALIGSDILKKLMKQNTEEYDEDISLGPTLLSTINAAGVSKFTELEVKGNNESITLNKKDVNNDLELALSSNGTVNLNRKGAKSSILIKEITEISIKN